ncbi:MAG: F-BAR domain-containing protein [Acidobacteriota bacterium]|nr:F-BAR domain-containing protein [Acidobacteriota bacterium]
MKKFFVSLVILILCGTSALAQETVTPLSLLTQKNPAVKWNAKSQIKGDFDYDGINDYAVRGIKGVKFVVGIVKGSVTPKSKYWTLEFGEDAGDQGSLCSVKSAVISVDDIDKDYVEFASEYLEADYAKRLENLPKNSKGITVADGMCDSFHVFWDKKAKEFTFWRI